MEATRDDPGIFFIEYVPRKEQTADILTKGFFSQSMHGAYCVNFA